MQPSMTEHVNEFLAFLEARHPNTPRGWPAVVTACNGWWAGVDSGVEQLKIGPSDPLPSLDLAPMQNRRLLGNELPEEIGQRVVLSEIGGKRFVRLVGEDRSTTASYAAWINQYVPEYLTPGLLAVGLIPLNPQSWYEAGYTIGQVEVSANALLAQPWLAFGLRKVVVVPDLLTPEEIEIEGDLWVSLEKYLKGSEGFKRGSAEDAYPILAALGCEVRIAGGEGSGPLEMWAKIFPRTWEVVVDSVTYPIAASGRRGPTAWDLMTLAQGDLEILPRAAYPSPEAYLAALDARDAKIKNEVSRRRKVAAKLKAKALELLGGPEYTKRVLLSKFVKGTWANPSKSDSTVLIESLGGKVDGAVVMYPGLGTFRIEGYKGNVSAYDLIRLSCPYGKEWEAERVKRAEVFAKLIVKAREILGLPADDEPVAPRVPRKALTDLSIRTCQVCFRDIKVEPMGNGVGMVLHGYRRPGHGSVEGRCPGTGQSPYEHSNRIVREVLTQEEASAKKTLDRLRYIVEMRPTLQREDIQVGPDGTPVTVTLAVKSGEDTYGQVFSTTIANIASELRFAWRGGFLSVPWYRFTVKDWQRWPDDQPMRGVVSHVPAGNEALWAGDPRAEVERLLAGVEGWQEPGGWQEPESEPEGDPEDELDAPARPAFVPPPAPERARPAPDLPTYLELAEAVASDLTKRIIRLAASEWAETGSAAKTEALLEIGKHQLAYLSGQDVVDQVKGLSLKQKAELQQALNTVPGAIGQVARRVWELVSSEWNEVVTEADLSENLLAAPPGYEMAEEMGQVPLWVSPPRQVNTVYDLGQITGQMQSLMWDLDHADKDAKPAKVYRGQVEVIEKAAASRGIPTDDLGKVWNESDPENRDSVEWRQTLDSVEDREADEASDSGEIVTREAPERVVMKIEALLSRGFAGNAKMHRTPPAGTRLTILMGNPPVEAPFALFVKEQYEGGIWYPKVTVRSVAPEAVVAGSAGVTELIKHRTDKMMQDQLTKMVLDADKARRVAAPVSTPAPILTTPVGRVVPHRAPPLGAGFHVGQPVTVYVPTSLSETRVEARRVAVEPHYGKVRVTLTEPGKRKEQQWDLDDKHQPFLVILDGIQPFDDIEPEGALGFMDIAQYRYFREKLEEWLAAHPDVRVILDLGAGKPIEPSGRVGRVKPPVVTPAIPAGFDSFEVDPTAPDPRKPLREYMATLIPGKTISLGERTVGFTTPPTPEPEVAPSLEKPGEGAYKRIVSITPRMRSGGKLWDWGMALFTSLNENVARMDVYIPSDASGSLGGKPERVGGVGIRVKREEAPPLAPGELRVPRMPADGWRYISEAHQWLRPQGWQSVKMEGEKTEAVTHYRNRLTEEKGILRKVKSRDYEADKGFVGDDQFLFEAPEGWQQRVAQKLAELRMIASPGAPTPKFADILDGGELASGDLVIGYYASETRVYRVEGNKLREIVTSDTMRGRRSARTTAGAGVPSKSVSAPDMTPAKLDVNGPRVLEGVLGELGLEAAPGTRIFRQAGNRDSYKFLGRIGGEAAVEEEREAPPDPWTTGVYDVAAAQAQLDAVLAKGEWLWLATAGRLATEGLDYGAVSRATGEVLRAAGIEASSRMGQGTVYGSVDIKIGPGQMEKALEIIHPNRHYTDEMSFKAGADHGDRSDMASDYYNPGGATIAPGHLLRWLQFYVRAAHGFGREKPTDIGRLIWAGLARSGEGSEGSSGTGGAKPTGPRGSGEKLSKWVSSKYGSVEVVAGAEGKHDAWNNIHARVGGKAMRYGYSARQGRWAKHDVPPSDLLDEVVAHGHGPLFGREAVAVEAPSPVEEPRVGEPSGDQEPPKFTEDQWVVHDGIYAQVERVLPWDAFRGTWKYHVRIDGRGPLYTWNETGLEASTAPPTEAPREGTAEEQVRWMREKWAKADEAADKANREFAEGFTKGMKGEGGLDEAVATMQQEHAAFQLTGQDGKTHFVWAKTVSDAVQQGRRWGYKHEGLATVHRLIPQPGDEAEGMWDRATRRVVYDGEHET